MGKTSARKVEDALKELVQGAEGGATEVGRHLSIAP